MVDVNPSHPDHGSGSDTAARTDAVPRPAFTDWWLPPDPRALVLVLHGGTQRSVLPVDGRSLSWRRARAVGRHVAGKVRSDGVGVALLRYGVKGWNSGRGSAPAPVIDARWALEDIAEQHDVPVVVLGHSMGARTGVAVADHPSVRGVVALAPWLPPEDSVEPLAGKLLRAGHGQHDRITSARATKRFVDRASSVADAEFTDMGPLGHYLLRGFPRWNAFAVDSVREVIDRTVH
ncbi:alpha/beta hydrolase family protein [Nocardioides sp. J9]|nr:alpha/beta hydrolase family protein [Nocardioides sp. J9]